MNLRPRKKNYGINRVIVKQLAEQLSKETIRAQSCVKKAYPFALVCEADKIVAKIPQEYREKQQYRHRGSYINLPLPEPPAVNEEHVQESPAQQKS